MREPTASHRSPSRPKFPRQGFGSEASPPDRRPELASGGEFDARVRELAGRTDAIVVFSEGELVYANPAAAKLFRAGSVEELHGRSPLSLVEPEFQALATEDIRRVLEEGRSTEPTEYQCRRQDGARVDIEVSAGPICWNGVPSLLAIGRDITRRSRAEKTLRAARRAAEDVNQAKSEFLAIVSHELRTPLSAVIGCAHLLEEEVQGDLSPRQKEAVARIRTSSWHLLGIVEQILTFSRIEANREEVRRDPTEVNQLVGEVVDILRPRAEAAGIELHQHVGREPLIARTDAGRVRQILVNLVDNAIKYAPGGRVELLLEGCGSGTIRIDVKDSGPGIPVEDHERIFEPFTRTGSHAGIPQSGTGLGLSISRELARLLDGDLTVDSRPEEGSTFSLWLPAE